MPIATLSDVGKRYVKYDDVPTLVTGIRHMFKRGKRGDLWAVRHLDLEVERGQAIGIIGRNGSGKSTTLSMLAGVTAPTEGTVRVNGRIAPLLRLGVGFEQELTGRENVFINGMILGVPESVTRKHFDEIVAFAEMESFIDTPVKFYSSGMMVRLGFAAAVAAQPDLLIVDEVLAVGDVAFQARSFERMIQLREQGTTLVVVSHNMQSIRRLAEHVVVLHHGEVRYRGATPDGISMYHDLLRVSLEADGDTASQSATVLSFEMHREDGSSTANVTGGEAVTFEMRVRFDLDVERAVFGLAIATESGQFVYSENSMGKIERTYRAGEEHAFKVRVPLDLVSGSYTATGGLRWGEVTKHQLSSTPKIFYVSGRPLVRGIADLHADFTVETAGDETDQR